MTDKIFPGSGKEATITRAIMKEYFDMVDSVLESDVMIIGAGPSGLIAGADLAKNGKNVVILEANNYLGGGFWVGGCYLNKATFRAPSHTIIQDFGVPLKEWEDGIWVGDAPHACAATIKHAMDCGVKVMNLLFLEDLVVKNGQVCGGVINWLATKFLPKNITCLDPLALECKIMIDATGHGADAVSLLAKRGLVESKNRDFPMNVELSEEELVNRTGKVYPGLYACGMSAATTFGLHRMGPTFGSMLLSGKRVAELILKDEFAE